MPKKDCDTVKEIKKRSVVPIYAMAAFWVIYALFAPMYKLWHYIVFIAVGLAVYLIFSKLFPGTVEYVKEPEKPKEPETTGNPEIDAMLKEGAVADSELRRLEESINVPSVKAKIAEIRDLTAKIFGDLKDDPTDLPQVRRFASYYLPTTIKLLNTYDRMCIQNISGQNITDTMKKIESALDSTVQAYKRQLDALFENQALDIDTDISVMESMLKKSGLSGSDFNFNTNTEKKEN